MKHCLLVAGLVCAVLAKKTVFDNFKVYRIWPQTDTALEILKNLQQNETFDFWQEPTVTGRSVDLMVSPVVEPYLANILSSQFFQHNIIINNVQKLIGEERAQNRSTRFAWDDYRSLDEVLFDLVWFNNAFFVCRSTIGYKI